MDTGHAGKPGSTDRTLLSHISFIVLEILKKSTLILFARSNSLWLQHRAQDVPSDSVMIG